MKKRAFIFEEDEASLYSYIGKPYFGDDTKQNKALEEIENALPLHGRIHLIYGPTSSGKSSLIEGLKKKIRKNPGVSFYDLTAEDKHPFNPPPASNILIFLHEDQFPESGLKSSISEAEALLARYPQASVILEAVKPCEPPIGYMKSPQMLRGQRSADDALKRLTAGRDNIIIHEVGYSLAQVQQELWALHDDMQKYFTNASAALREVFFATCKNPLLDEVFAALQEQDRARYRAAFGRIKEIARQKQQEPLPG